MGDGPSVGFVGSLDRALGTRPVVEDRAQMSPNGEQPMAFARRMTSRSTAGSRLTPPRLGAAKTALAKPRRSRKDSHVFNAQKLVKTLAKAWDTEALDPRGTCSSTPLRSIKMAEILGYSVGSGSDSGVPGGQTGFAVPP